MLCDKCKTILDLGEYNDITPCKTCGDLTINDDVCEECSDEYNICSNCGASTEVEIFWTCYDPDSEFKKILTSLKLKKNILYENKRVGD